jgi:outer membrane protein insertion porin family
MGRTVSSGYDRTNDETASVPVKQVCCWVRRNWVTTAKIYRFGAGSLMSLGVLASGVSGAIIPLGNCGANAAQLPGSSAGKAIPVEKAIATDYAAALSGDVAETASQTREPVSTSASDLEVLAQAEQTPSALSQTTPFTTPGSLGIPPERRVVRFQFGPRLSLPTVLQGPLRPRLLDIAVDEAGFSVTGSARLPLGDTNNINLAVQGGESVLSFDLSYNDFTPAPRRGFGVNVFNQRSYFPAFRGGDRTVELPNGDVPWLHRLGGGAEVYLPIGNAIQTAIGASYQRVSVRDSVFTSRLFPVDELGNALTLDRDGIDDLMTFNFAAIRSTLDRRASPTSGNVIRVGLDQGFTLGSESATFTRLSAYYLQFIPANLFGFAEGPRTLIFGLQGGTILGDVLPYEGFNAGTDATGAIGTGRSFLVGTLQYRFPIANFRLFQRDLNLRGVIFSDYATNLGTAGDVIGRPAVVREKANSRISFGTGLHLNTPFGLGRLEVSLDDVGDTRLVVVIGDRF